MTEDIAIDEDGKVHAVYGLEAVCADLSEVYVSVPDIFSDKLKAEEFIDLINREQLSLIHLYEVIDDILSDI